MGSFTTALLMGLGVWALAGFNEWIALLMLIGALVGLVALVERTK